MTIDECKIMLIEVRRAKARARRIRSNIEEMERDIAALALKSCLTPKLPSGGGVHSSVEQIVVRLADKRQAFEVALQAAFELEDKLAAAMKALTSEEQDVITGLFMRGLSAQKVAGSMYFSRRTLYRIKERAVAEMAKNFEV